LLPRCRTLPPSNSLSDPRLFPPSGSCWSGGGGGGGGVSMPTSRPGRRRAELRLAIYPRPETRCRAHPRGLEALTPVLVATSPSPVQSVFLSYSLGPVCVVGDASCCRFLVMPSFFALSLPMGPTDGRPPSSLQYFRAPACFPAQQFIMRDAEGCRRERGDRRARSRSSFVLPHRLSTQADLLRIHA
jgi:hypothetical protein